MCVFVYIFTLLSRIFCCFFVQIFNANILDFIVHIINRSVYDIYDPNIRWAVISYKKMQRKIGTFDFISELTRCTFR